MTAVEAPAPQPPQAGRGRFGLFALALIVAGTAAYWNSVTVPLLLDDIASIGENPSIRALWPLSTVLSPPSDVGLGGRPVANLSFALNYAFGGTSVRGYHAVNLAIHLAAALTLFSLIRLTLAGDRMKQLVPAATRDWAAFGSALLWLLHPLQTEAVTYLSQRTESLMALFYLLTLLAFARGATGGGGRWFVLAVVACALGMGTKEVMVTVPVMTLLYDRTFVSGSFAAAWRNHRRVYLGLAATWALLLFLLVDVHERGVGYKAVTAWQYLLTESRAIVTYLRLAVWPHPLVFDYGSETASALSEVWPQAIVICVLLAATVIGLARRPLLGFGGAWVFIALSPTSSFVPVAAQPIAEHRMYLPLVAIATAVVLVAYIRLRSLAHLVVALLVVAAGVATAYRNLDYRTALALWNDTVEKAPRNARAHAGLGAALLEKGDIAAAIGALQRAVQFDPQLAEAHNNLAMALSDTERAADSVAHFTAALKLKPGVASTHYNFGNVLLQLGRPAEAIAQQQQALALRPAFPEAQCALANALAATGRLPGAITHYEASLRLQPNLTAARFGLANALLNSGRGADAIPHYEATLKAVPDSPDAHFNLGNAFAVSGRFPDAIRHYEITLRLRPDFPSARANLDAVRAAAQRAP